MTVSQDSNKIWIQQHFFVGSSGHQGYQEYQELSEIFRKRYLTQSKSRWWSIFFDLAKLKDCETLRGFAINNVSNEASLLTFKFENDETICGLMRNKLNWDNCLKNHIECEIYGQCEVYLFVDFCSCSLIHIWRHWAIIGCRLAIQQNNAFTYNKHHVSVDKQGGWSNREVAKQMRQKRKWVSRQ